MTQEEHKIALAEIERLMDQDPPKDSVEGMLLAQLAEKVQKHEAFIYGERMSAWRSGIGYVKSRCFNS